MGKAAAPRLLVPLLPVLVLAGAAAAQEELAFEKDPVSCKAIGFEVCVPVGWKVAQDRTGLSAQGATAGFVVTREPLLCEEKEFASQWQGALNTAGIAAQVDSTRAGRYRAYHARWPSKTAPDRTVDVYRVYVDDLEMVYNLSFSTKKGVDADELAKGVFKSFKVTDKGIDLELEEKPIRVGNAGTLQLPKGCVETKVGRFGQSVAYRRYLPGYATPKIAVEIRLDSARMPAISMHGELNNSEDLIAYFVQEAGLGEAKWDGKPKTKSASFGGCKGDALFGRFRHESGEMMEACIWAAKGKPEWPMVLILAHDREVRLHKGLFRTILKSYKSAR